MDKKIIKINFGCFSSGLPGWINVDKARKHIIISRIWGLPRLLYSLGFLKKYVYGYHVRGKFKNVFYGDARKRMRFRSNSVDYIYSSHMLEHIYPKEAVYFLSECRRVLKKGGVLRVVLPDLEAEAKVYLSSLGNPKAAEIFSDKVYATSFKEGRNNNHKWMYDQYSLSDILKRVGFSRVVLGKHGVGSFPDVGRLDAHEGSLIIEGVK
jgi:SAM-dependent methyltransferase